MHTVDPESSDTNDCFQGTVAITAEAPLFPARDGDRPQMSAGQKQTVAGAATSVLAHQDGLSWDRR